MRCVLTLYGDLKYANAASAGVGNPDGDAGQHLRNWIGSQRCAMDMSVLVKTWTTQKVTKIS